MYTLVVAALCHGSILFVDSEAIHLLLGRTGRCLLFILIVLKSVAGGTIATASATVGAAGLFAAAATATAAIALPLLLPSRLLLRRP